MQKQKLRTCGSFQRVTSMYATNHSADILACVHPVHPTSVCTVHQRHNWTVHRMLQPDTVLLCECVWLCLNASSSSRHTHTHTPKSHLLMAVKSPEWSDGGRRIEMEMGGWQDYRSKVKLSRQSSNLETQITSCKHTTWSWTWNLSEMHTMKWIRGSAGRQTDQ